MEAKMIPALKQSHYEEVKQIGPRISVSVADSLADYSKRTRMPQALIVEAALRDLLKDAGYDV
jgi:hypothetical protein